MDSSFTKPKKLSSGSRVAVVSLSWGGPGALPQRFDSGKRQCEQEFGITLVEMPHTRAEPSWVAGHPQARAEDLMAAFEDDAIDGIISSIGGDDSIRTIPFVNLATIARHPKVFLGYSDTTVAHLACFKAGIVSFYGPSVMSGFAENGGMHPYMIRCLRQMIFEGAPHIIRANMDGWTDEHLDWQVAENQSRIRRLQPASGWTLLQGHGAAEGRLLGGCIEVLDWLRGTCYWPTLEQWHGAILFLEPSEEAPSPLTVTRMLRCYAAQGILHRISALLFGRPAQVPAAMFEEYDRAILRVVRDEEGLAELPVMTRMDFGHTDPIMTLPHGAMARLDCEEKTLEILEETVR